MAGQIIALVTDFGAEEFYPGVLKAVIQRISPDCRVIDLCHSIPSFFPPAAAFVLEKNFFYFPAGTIFLAVVDPGVGSSRKIILLQFEHYFFIAADNGTLTPFLLAENRRAYRLDQPQFFLTDEQSSFESRDKMAPVAAYLARGVAADCLGSETTDVFIDGRYFPEFTPGKLRGTFLYKDKFGNLITNISNQMFRDFAGEKKARFCFKDYQSESVFKTFAQGEKLPFMLYGSHGNIEIACNQFSAADFLHAEPGNSFFIRKF